MKNINSISAKIFDLPGIKRKIAQERNISRKVSFTNGCFDILHRGHIASLSEAASLADFLIVGINSDSSTKKLKGEGRPINDEQSRALVIASLSIVDAVIIFNDDTPLELIKLIRPEYLVKGGDYTIDHVVGAKEVISWGGEVVINPLVQGLSTTGILKKIKSL